jgi:hypothetical protein
MGWDVFISHASEDKANIAIPLKNALETLGISVWIDNEQIKLGDGFRSQIDRGLQSCRFGIVILSPRFFQKPWASAELDAFFHMEMSSSGTKLLLPVIYDMSYEDVQAHSKLLGGRRAILWKDGIDNVVAAIAEVVSCRTGGATTSAPKAPPSHTVSAAEPLIFIMSTDGHTQYAEIVEIENDMSQVRATLKCADPADTATIVELGRNRGQTLRLAYGTTAIIGRVERAILISKGSNQVGVLTIKNDTPANGNVMEMSVQGMSPDKLADLRARRILLNDSGRPLKKGSGVETINDSFLEMFIAGQDGSIKVKESPIPILYRQFHHKPELFLSLSRLAAVMYLCLSNAVQDILRLDLKLDGPLLTVNFSGRRARRFSNVEPPVINVVGTIELSAN